jgi:hypothetical protein
MGLAVDAEPVYGTMLSPSYISSLFILLIKGVVSG